jgi:thiol-disulfide isomerase/thioredoxin
VGRTALLGLSLVAAVAERDGWEVLRVPARDFAVKDLSGHVLRARDLSGKIVVVDFWATWCAPCIKELPDLSAYQERLKGRSDVAFLSFDVTDPRDTVEAFVKEKKIGFSVYLADALLGPYEVTGFPTKLIIDMREDQGEPAKAANKGVVRFRREGSAPVPSIEARVAELLAEKP